MFESCLSMNSTMVYAPSKHWCSVMQKDEEKNKHKMYIHLNTFHIKAFFINITMEILKQ